MDFLRVEPPEGSEEWKINLLYASPESYFLKYPNDRSERNTATLACNLFGRRGLVLVDPTFLDDGEIIHAAMKFNSDAFEFASYRLRDDFTYAFFAVDFEVSNLQYVSDRLKEDETFVLAMDDLFPRGQRYGLDRIEHASAFDFLPEHIKVEVGSGSLVDYFKGKFYDRLVSLVPPVAPRTKTMKVKI